MLDLTLIVNHQLFSDYYLGQILNKVTKKRNVQREKAWQSLVTLYNRNSFESEERLRARTERFYDKIFKALGYALQDGITVELEEESFEVSRKVEKEEELVALVQHLPYGYSYDKKRRRGKKSFPSYSNAFKESLEELGLGWGVMTNGETLRIVKAGAGKAYLEFRIAEMCRYATQDIYENAFSVLYELLEPEHFNEAYLDSVYEESKKHGTQVSNTLKDAVLESIELFARGVLANPKNREFIGEDITELYEESIIFMYRMLFILYAEAHNLLPVADNPIYKENYSLDHLVNQIRRPSYEPDPRSTSLWLSLKALFRILEHGISHKSCAIAALNGHLNSSQRHPLLEKVELSDDVTYEIIKRLTLTQVRGGGLDRISYRELDVAQLGAVYEGLLEYEPKIAEYNLTTKKIKGNEQLIRAEADDPVVIREGEFYLSLWGGSRKGSGSYYTPKELTTFLVEKTLEPLVKNRSSEELLQLKVIDTAMGSGAFLVAAINYLARVYGQKLIDEGIDEDGIMDDDEFMQYKRLIAEHCIYGVDLKPTAVELAKLSIWLTTFAKDRPLTFLDHRLRTGNSLVGAWLEKEVVFSSPRALKGKKLNSLYFVPKEALAPSKKLHSKEHQERLKALQKKNQEEYIPAIINLQTTNLVEQDIDLGFIESLVRHRMHELNEEECSAEDVKLKAALFEAERESGGAFDRLKRYMDLTCAVWFWESEEILPPHSVELYDIRKYLFGQELYFGTSEERIEAILQEAERIAKEQNFFHWELEYPELYFDEEVKRLDNPGFDTVVGNPPWDIVKPNSQEFFSNFDPYFRDYGKQEALRAIKSLCEDESIDREWQRYQLFFEKASVYFKTHYPYQYKGDLNTYKLFTERNFSLLKNGGEFGIIIPSGWYTDEGSMMLRKLFLEQSRINFLFSFENKGKKFFPIHASLKFILLSAKKGSTTYTFPAQFMMHDDKELYEHEKFVHIDKRLIEKFSPDTLSINEFQNQEDIDIATKIYDDHPLLGEKLEDNWNVKFKREFDMTNHSYLFKTQEQLQPGIRYLPLFEGKMFHQFYDKFEEGRYWIAEEDGREALTKANTDEVNEDYRYYRVSIRDIARSTDSRTCLGAVLPPNIFLGNTIHYTIIEEKVSLFFIALMTSFSLEFVQRKKVASHLNQSVMKTLPIPRLNVGNMHFDALVPRALRLVATGNEYADLWNEVAPEIDFASLNTQNAPLGYPSQVDFARCGPEWSPDYIIEGKTDTANRFDIADRAQLRAEIDAIVAHLYGLNREEMSYILDTFTALRNAEEREFGEFRSKRMVLEEMERLEESRQKEGQA